jgi:hypothetical protein
MNAPVKVCKMTPASDLIGVNVHADPLYLDDIPKAMDNMGWIISARLMRRWFATRPAWAMPQEWRSGPPVAYTEMHPSQVDDHIVKMDWALKFKQVRAALNELRTRWASPEGLRQLGKRLERVELRKGLTRPLGDRRMSAKELDTSCQVNYWELGGIWDTLDDYYGSIFKATLKVAVVGTAYRSVQGSKVLFEAEHLGFYIRDTYDFNAGWADDVFMGLGVWSKQRVLSKAEMAGFKALSSPNPSHLVTRHLQYPRFVQVRNHDFRRWQQQCNGGGDFFVFSDVLWESYRGPAIELP